MESVDTVAKILSTPEIYGIAGVAIVAMGILVYLAIKLQAGHAKALQEQLNETRELTKKAITVIEQNAESRGDLKTAVNSLVASTDKNTEATKMAAEVSRQTKDSFSQLLLALIKEKQ